jgi:hypothetical protein
LHPGRQRTLRHVDVKRCKFLLAVALYLDEKTIESGFGGIESEMQIGPATIFGCERSRDLGMNVQGGGAVFAEPHNMSKGSHDWLELCKACAVGLRDVHSAFGRFAGLKRAIKRKSVLKAVHACR